MSDLALTETLERLLLHVWPSVETVPASAGPAWVLRFAHGYSSRANSAAAISAGAVVGPAILREAENYFSSHGLPATFRITPLVTPASIPVLKAHGYVRKDEAITMTASLDARSTRLVGDIVMRDEADDQWLSGVTALNSDESKRNPAHLKTITSRMEQPVAFASIAHQGIASGYAICAIRDGWAELGSIIIAPQARGRGLGRKLVAGLLHWASENGAARAFLQVDADNSAAIALYRSLGFADCYAYSTWRKPRPAVAAVTGRGERPGPRSGPT